MAVYKVGSTKLEPFKPGLKSSKLKISVVTDNLNRIQFIEIEDNFTQVKEIVKFGGRKKEAWGQVEKIFEKALKDNKTRQNR